MYIYEAFRRPERQADVANDAIVVGASNNRKFGNLSWMAGRFLIRQHRRRGNTCWSLLRERWRRPLRRMTSYFV